MAKRTPRTRIKRNQIKTISNSYLKSDFYGILDTAFFFHGREATEKAKDAILLME